MAKSRLTEDGPADAALFSWDGPCLVEQSTGLDGGVVQFLTWDYGPDTFRPLAQRRRTWVDGADQDAVDEAFHAVITDLVGTTPTELVTGDGRIAWHAASTPCGRTVATGVEDDVDCPLRFPGQYHDAETGLHYNLYRYYSPESAAYLTPDPLGLAPSPNDHSYVGNPMTAIGPLGLYELPEGAVTAGIEVPSIHPTKASTITTRNMASLLVRHLASISKTRRPGAIEWPSPAPSPTTRNRFSTSTRAPA